MVSSASPLHGLLPVYDAEYLSAFSTVYRAGERSVFACRSYTLGNSRCAELLCVIEDGSRHNGFVGFLYIVVDMFAVIPYTDERERVGSVTLEVHLISDIFLV